MISKTPSAVILGLYGANGVGVARSLGRENIPIDGFHVSNNFPHAFYSKYLNRNFLVSNEEQLLEELIKYGKQQDSRGVIFCTGDNYVLFVQKNHKDLKQHFILPLSASYDNLEDIMDKSKVLHIAEEAGFNVPEHTTLSNDSVFSLKFPIFLKPFLSVGNSKQDMKIIRTKSELEKMRYDLLSKYGDMEVESFIPGPITNQVEVHSYLTSNNETLIGGMLRYNSEFKNKDQLYLTGSFEKTQFYKELVKPITKLTECLRFKGPLDINLKINEDDNKKYFHEVNLRTSANLMIDTEFGLNLPAIVYLDLTGQDCSALLNKDLQLGKLWVSDRRLMLYYSKGKFKINTDLISQHISEGAVHSFFDKEDPNPFYFSLIQGQLDTLSVEIKTI